MEGEAGLWGLRDCKHLRNASDLGSRIGTGNTRKGNEVTSMPASGPRRPPASPGVSLGRHLWLVGRWLRSTGGCQRSPPRALWCEAAERRSERREQQHQTLPTVAAALGAPSHHRAIANEHREEVPEGRTLCAGGQ